jgi:hypothetical protein
MGAHCVVVALAPTTGYGPRGLGVQASGTWPASREKREHARVQAATTSCFFCSFNPTSRTHLLDHMANINSCVRTCIYILITYGKITNGTNYVNEKNTYVEIVKKCSVF